MGKTVYVGNMSFETTGDRLATLFAGHGKVTDVRVITDQYTHRPKGFAFVDMATEAAAEAAISELNGLTVDGRQLKVAEARPRKPRVGDVYTYSGRRG